MLCAVTGIFLKIIRIYALTKTNSIYSFWTIPAKTWWQLQASYINRVVEGIDNRREKEEIAKWFLQNYPDIEALPWTQAGPGCSSWQE